MEYSLVLNAVVELAKAEAVRAGNKIVCMEHQIKTNCFVANCNYRIEGYW